VLGKYGFADRRFLRKTITVLDDTTVRYSFDLAYDSRERLNEEIFRIIKGISNHGMVIRQIRCTPVE
jgi:hypothetical protein